MGREASKEDQALKYQAKNFGFYLADIGEPLKIFEH